MSGFLQRIRDHPAVVWVAAIGPTVAVVFGAWFYLEDRQRFDDAWYADDVQWNEELLATIRDIHTEMATQSLRLEELGEQLRYIGEVRFEELERTHEVMMQMISREAAADAYRQGLQEGMELR